MAENRRKTVYDDIEIAFLRTISENRVAEKVIGRIRLQGKQGRIQTGIGTYAIFFIGRTCSSRTGKERRAHRKCKAGRTYLKIY